MMFKSFMISKTSSGDVPPSSFTSSKLKGLIHALRELTVSS